MSKIPPWMRITFTGRINRLRFFWYTIGLSFVIGIPTFLLMALFVLEDQSSLIPFILFPIQIYGIVYSISMDIRRLHDLNRTGWLALLVIIPIINFFLMIYLAFFKGTDGPNKYGSDPLDYEKYSDYLEA